MRKFAIFVAAAVVAARISVGALFAEDTLYHDLGERNGIAKIVDAATVNFLADDRIKSTFDNTNMERFKLLLTDQLCTVAGGPCVYKGRTMTDTHKGLHLTNFHFNSLVEDLQKGMEKCDIPFRTQNRLLARLAPMQHDIVTK